ncbi:MAG: hypothetical protein GPJ52_00055 [Candidatus Heimdallarchaeota archaeon]|nr:hypothetical protein [Candidatus Heimdallarchaeota archaeon]
MTQKITWEKRTLPIEVPVAREESSKDDPLHSSPTFLENWKNIPLTKGTIKKGKYAFKCDIYKVRETFVFLHIVLQKAKCTAPPELYVVFIRNRTTGAIEFFNEKQRTPLGFVGKHFLEQVIVDYKKDLLDGFRVPSVFWEAQDELADPKERSHAPPF